MAAAGTPLASADLAEGFVRLSNAHMAKAIRSISLAKGYDPRDYVLVPFGGAGGQHACAMAAELQIPRILCHPDAGLLSAYGIGLADVTRHRVRNLSALHAADRGRLGDAASRDGGRSRWPKSSPKESRPIGSKSAARWSCAIKGSSNRSSIRAPDAGDYAAAFAAEHQQALRLRPRRPRAGDRRRAGGSPRPIGHVAARVAAASRRTRRRPPPKRRCILGGRWHAGAGFRLGQQSDAGRRDRRAGIDCRSLVHHRHRSRLAGEVLSQGELLLERDRDETGASAQTASSGCARQQPTDAADPILLEIFNNQFAGIADEMGITLRNTASSVNVKERLDFSCAIFTAAGDLVVNAPHIPVHLGAMSETVKRILADNPRLRPGDVFVTNDPYRGGSHLPDVTVVTPFTIAPGQLRFFTASRAHHAEIGGIAPGSMPPFSRNLAEEGVLIRNFQLFTAGEPHWDELRRVARCRARIPAATSPTTWPTSRPKWPPIAAVPATWTRWSSATRWPVVSAYMGHIQRAAAEKVSRALGRLRSPARAASSTIWTTARRSPSRFDLAGGRAVFDFTGTGPVLAGQSERQPRDHHRGGDVRACGPWSTKTFR